MSDKIIEKSIKQEYKYGFHTSIDQDTFPPGLNREIICKLSFNQFIESIKNEMIRKDFEKIINNYVNNV